MSPRGRPAFLGEGKFNVRPKEERTYAGRVFHSRLEARHAAELDLRIRAGEVACWRPQVRIPLCGKSGRRVAWVIIDFEVTYPDGHIVYEETKGWETPESKLKRRWLEADYPELALRVIR